MQQTNVLCFGRGNFCSNILRESSDTIFPGLGWVGNKNHVPKLSQLSQAVLAACIYIITWNIWKQYSTIHVNKHTNLRSYCAQIDCNETGQGQHSYLCLRFKRKLLRSNLAVSKFWLQGAGYMCLHTMLQLLIRNSAFIINSKLR